MRKQARREPNPRRAPSSNKKKRAQLQAKRGAKRSQVEKRRLVELGAEGRLANGEGLPEGAIAADLSQQAPNNSYSGLLYYVDQPFTCVDCRAEEVWTATQQKWYYEVAKGSIYGRAIRCRKCRQRVNSQREHIKRRSGTNDP